jgi:hypothetical protein
MKTPKAKCIYFSWGMFNIMKPKDHLSLDKKHAVHTHFYLFANQLYHFVQEEMRLKPEMISN